MSSFETEERNFLPYEEALHPEAELVTPEFLQSLPGLQAIENVGNCGRTLYYWGARTRICGEEATVFVGLDRVSERAQITVVKDNGDREEWVVDNNFPDNFFYDSYFFLGSRSGPMTTLISTSQEFHLSHRSSLVELPLWKIRYKDRSEQVQPSTRKIGDIDSAASYAGKGYDLIGFAQVNQVIREALKNPQKSVGLPQVDGEQDGSLFPFHFH